MQKAAKSKMRGFMLISLLGLLGLSLGMPLQEGSTESDFEQPDRCKLDRPRSSSKCADKDKVRPRFFLHETHTKGCKKFGICSQDADLYDNRTNLELDNYFLTYEDCQATCMQYVNCSNLLVGDNVRIISDEYIGWGRKIVYGCKDGYSLLNNVKSIRTCQKDGSWSGVAPVCLKQCSAPSSIKHAYIAPSKSFHNPGSTVHYTCHVGYQLTGNSIRTCGTNGEWTGEEPSCVCRVAAANNSDECISCPEPGPIEHGHVIAPIRSLDAIINYTCDEGYILIGNEARQCNVDGEWSGDEPICWKLNIVRVLSNGNEDVTNSTVTLAYETTNAKFKAISSIPNPFNNIELQWNFSKPSDSQNELPHSVEQNGMELIFSNIFKSREQEGNYSINIGNYFAFFKLIIVESPQITMPPSIMFHPKSTRVNLGGEASFHCIVSGYPVPEVRWYHNDVEVVDGDERRNKMIAESHGYTAAYLSIFPLNASDSGTYRCVANNGIGNPANSLEAHLTITNHTKRSVDEEDSRTSLCSSDSEHTVLILGRLKKKVKWIRNDLKNYRVQVERFLQPTDKDVGNGGNIKTVILDTEPSSNQRLNPNTDYIFKGRLLNKTLFVSRQNIHRHTQELEDQVNSC